MFLKPDFNWHYALVWMIDIEAQVIPGSFQLLTLTNVPPAASALQFARLMQ